MGKDDITLYHASKIKNHKKIMKDGLKAGLKPSGYGDKPLFRAVYLYHKNNIDVPCDLIDLNGVVDIYEVTIKDTSKLLPDEDSGAKTWKDSIEIMGTCAYSDDIPITNIKYKGRVGDETKIKEVI